MDIKILVILVAVANFLFGAVLLSRSKKNRASIAFSVFAFALGFWSLAMYFYERPLFLSQLIWIKIVYSIVLFPVIPSVFYFALNFSKTSEKKIDLPLVFYFPPAIILLGILWFSDLWVKGVAVNPGGAVQTLLGPAYIYFGIFSGLFGAWLLVVLVKKYLKFSGVLKIQLKYIFVGLFLYIGSTVLIDVIIPLVFGNSNLFWLSTFSTLFFIGLTTYAITRYRLMDIRLAIGRGAIYLLSFAVVVGAGYLLGWLNSLLAAPLGLLSLLPLLAVVSVLLFLVCFKLFEKIASRWFYYTFYSYQQVLSDLGKQIIQVLDLTKLSSLAVETLQTTMKLDRAVILLRETDGRFVILKNIGFKEENGISLVRDSFLTEYLQKTQKPLVFEELALAERDAMSEQEKVNLHKLQDNMQRIEANVCLPLFAGQDIIGIIVLGKKISGDAFSKEDLELLMALSSQLSVALQNSRLYEQVKDLSQNLQSKVKEQTQNISSLLAMKNEFLRVVNHQLRTPISIIKGMSSMLYEDNMPEKEEQDFKQKLYFSAERLSIILDDILTAQTLIGEKQEPDLSPCDAVEIVDEIVQKFSPQAKAKGIRLLFKKPDLGGEKLLLDETMFEKIVAHLIDNAILYTQEGGVVVELGLSRNSGAGQGRKTLEFSVEDTGLGIDETTKQNLFGLFHRGDQAKSAHPNGSGLGLFIVHEYVKAMGGTIVAESQGIDKGTTFSVRLPLLDAVG